MSCKDCCGYPCQETGVHLDWNKLMEAVPWSKETEIVLQGCAADKQLCVSDLGL